MRTKRSDKAFPEYPFIRDEAQRGGTGLSEAELRRMLARGELPRFYVGETQKYFRIDHAALVELLQMKSKRDAAQIITQPAL